MPMPAPAPCSDANAIADDANDASADAVSADDANDANLDSVALHDLCNMNVIDLLDWPTFYEDMIKDVEKECQKFGAVVKVWADRQAVMASVWVRFSTAEGARRCVQVMDNRRFAGMKVRARLHRWVW